MQLALQIGLFPLVGNLQGGVAGIGLKTIGPQNRVGLGNGDAVAVGILPFCGGIISIPAGFGGAHTDPLAVNVDVVVHRQNVGADIGGVGAVDGRHQIAHHGEALLGVGEAGAALLRNRGFCVQQLRAAFREMDGPASGGGFRFHIGSIGDGHMNRRRRLDHLAVQQELNVEEAGKGQGLRLLLPGCQSRLGLVIIGLVLFGAGKNLPNRERHTIGQRRFRTVENGYHIILTGCLQPGQLAFFQQLIRLLLAVLRVDVLLQGTGSAAGLRMDMTGFTAVEGLLRQGTEPGNGAVGQGVGPVSHLIAGCALNGGQSGRFGIRGFFHGIDQRNVVGNTVALIVKEHQVAGQGSIGGKRLLRMLRICFRLPIGVGPGAAVPQQIAVLLRQSRHPTLAVGFQGRLLHITIVEAEGDEHGTPITIGVAVPLAVTGQPFLPAGFVYNIIPDAGGVAQLAFRNGQYVGTVLSGECHARHGGFPVCAGFQICGGIGFIFHRRLPAGFGMGVGLQAADNASVLVAGVGMLVGFLAAVDGIFRLRGHFVLRFIRMLGIAICRVGMLRKTADQDGALRCDFNLRHAIGVMLVDSDLQPPADPVPGSVIAAGLVNVGNDFLHAAEQLRVAFRLAADQDLGRLVTRLVMGVFLGILQAADERVLGFIACVRMNVAAGKASLGVDMLADFRQGTDQISGAVVACSIVIVDHEIRLPANQLARSIVAVVGVPVQHFGRQTGELGFKDRSLQRIAAFIVGMLL